MPAKRSSTASANASTVTIGFETKLWLNASKLETAPAA